MKRLVPLWWRLGSLPELADLPRKERRRLWNQAYKEVVKTHRVWWYGGYAGVFLLLIGAAELLGKISADAKFFLIWARLVETATAGLLRFGSQGLAELVWTILLFTVAFYVEGLLVQGAILRRLREMLARERKDPEFHSDKHFIVW